MVSLNEKAKALMKERGCTQKWVVQKMNEVNPLVKMDRSKFSAFITGKRQMSGDELIAFCLALKINPDVFVEMR